MTITLLYLMILLIGRHRATAGQILPAGNYSALSYHIFKKFCLECSPNCFKCEASATNTCYQCVPPSPPATLNSTGVYYGLDDNSMCVKCSNMLVILGGTSAGYQFFSDGNLPCHSCMHTRICTIMEYRKMTMMIYIVNYY